MATNGTYYNNTTGLHLSSGGSNRIDINALGVITFNTAYSFPTTAGSNNKVLISNGAGAMVFNTIPNASLDNSTITINGNPVPLGGSITTPNTNISIYSDNGILSADRTVNQDGYDLKVTSLSGEAFNIYDSNATADSIPRLRVEADLPYNTALELGSSSAKVYLIKGFDLNSATVFEVDPQGNLAATSKSFLIDHPTKEDHTLRYGSLEGPEHGVYVRGKLENGKTIELPDYWLELVDSNTITVQLTSIGSHQNLYVKDIVDNTVIVGNSNLLTSKVTCFYFIQAERKDIDSMVVEELKENVSI